MTEGRPLIYDLIQTSGNFHPASVISHLTTRLSNSQIINLTSIRLLIVIVLAVTIAACGSETETPKVMPRDTSITKDVAYNTLYLDSNRMETYFGQHSLPDTLSDAIKSFYNHRNYQFAWFDSTGLTEHASSFLEMQHQYIHDARDSSIFDPNLRSLLDSLEINGTGFHVDTAKRVATELLLTGSFFKYAVAAYEGNSNLQLQDLGWYIPRKKIDVKQLLDSLVEPGNERYGQYNPLNPQYSLLQQHLSRYNQLEQEHPWEEIVMKEKVIKPGNSSALLPVIKQRLLWLGDLETADTTDVLDSNTVAGVKRFQARHGLNNDGAIGAGFMKQLNISPAQRIRQLLINMERLRWVPAKTPADYLLVNIPAFQLFIYKNDSLDWSMNVVVGSSAHNTVIFRGDMKYVVFSPYWNVPNSIVRNEIEPALKKNPNYLAKNNMERYSGGIRQKPGVNNSLGLVKFLFPNQYNIYLHDTPAKSLFSRDQRAFSHGCIRLSEPRRLAEYLLRNDKKWPPEKIDKAMRGGKEVWVTLAETIPVYIGYFTAWQGSDGLLHFRDDVYGHDKKLAAKMF